MSETRRRTRKVKEVPREHTLTDSVSFLDKQAEIPEAHRATYEAFVVALAETAGCTTKKDWTARILALRKVHKVQPRKAQLKRLYETLLAKGEILNPNLNLEQYLTSRPSRSLSGVLVVGVLMSPYPKYMDKTTGRIKEQRFSCSANCYYCPKEPGMPRSYLSTEAAVARAARVNFDPIDQFYARCNTLKRLGHDIDKIELLILGGTFCQFPADYSEQFIRDLFWAANTFYDGNSDFKNKRPRQALEDEIRIHETASKCRIIGMTLETRPDSIDNFETIRKFREYGATRLQLGVQHTDDDVLTAINRGCLHEHTVTSLRMLKNAGYKIDIHLMPNLPGSTAEGDEKMFDLMLTDDCCQADQWKVYPCQTVEFSMIKKWYDEGKYKPYSLKRLMEVIVGMKSAIHPWIRLNRIFRALPAAQITSGITMSNFRQHMYAHMEAKGLKCRCIRCREIGTHIRREELSRRLQATKQAVPGHHEKASSDLRQKLAMKTVLRRREYRASGGTEIFISMESEDESVLKGFVRLRLPPQWVRPADREELGVSDRMPFLDGFELPADGRYGDVAEYEELHSVFPELYRAALVREAHVYGAKQKAKGSTSSGGKAGFGGSQFVGSKATGESAEKNKVREEAALTAQSKGYGSKLMADAEKIAKSKGYQRMAVIAGVGTRFYYRLKLGYKTAGSYVVKDFAETRIGALGRGDVNTKQSKALVASVSVAMVFVVTILGLMWFLSNALSLLLASAYLLVLDYIHFFRVKFHRGVSRQLVGLSKLALLCLNLAVFLKFCSAFSPTMFGIPDMFLGKVETEGSICSTLWASVLGLYVLSFYLLKMVLVKRMMTMIQNPIFGNDSGVVAVSWENKMIIPVHILAFTACELLVINFTTSSQQGSTCNDNFDLACIITAAGAIVFDSLIYWRFCSRWYAIMQVLMEQNAFIVLLQGVLVCVSMAGCLMDAAVHVVMQYRAGDDFNALDATFSFMIDLCIIATSLVLSFTDSVEFIAQYLFGDGGMHFVIGTVESLKHSLHIM